MIVFVFEKVYFGGYGEGGLESSNGNQGNGV